MPAGSRLDFAHIRVSLGNSVGFMVKCGWPYHGQPCGRAHCEAMLRTVDDRLFRNCGTRECAWGTHIRVRTRVIGWHSAAWPQMAQTARPPPTGPATPALHCAAYRRGCPPCRLRRLLHPGTLCVRRGVLLATMPPWLRAACPPDPLPWLFQYVSAVIGRVPPHRVLFASWLATMPAVHVQLAGAFWPVAGDAP